MKLSRHISRFICRLLAAALLFGQLMVAAYACPSLLHGAPVTVAPAAQAGEPADAEASTMPPGCDHTEKDPSAAALCSEHCKQGQQRADIPPAPMVQAAMPTLLYPLSGEPAMLDGIARTEHPAVQMSAVPEPPHAILHCVFRI